MILYNKQVAGNKSLSLKMISIFTFVLMVACSTTVPSVESDQNASKLFLDSYNALYSKTNVGFSKLSFSYSNKNKRLSGTLKIKFDSIKNQHRIDIFSNIGNQLGTIVLQGDSVFVNNRIKNVSENMQIDNFLETYNVELMRPQKYISTLTTGLLPIENEIWSIYNHSMLINDVGDTISVDGMGRPIELNRLKNTETWKLRYKMSAFPTDLIYLQGEERIRIKITYEELKLNTSNNRDNIGA